MHTRACFQVNGQESLKNKHICVVLMWTLEKKLTLQIGAFFKRYYFLAFQIYFK